MTQRQREALIHAANLIAKKQCDCICNSLNTSEVNLLDIKEAKMIDPFNDSFKTEYYAWWGYDTMNDHYWTDEARGARLIGIAMMLTMPKSFLS